MSFTYESKDNKEKFETYEWDNTWIDHPFDEKRKRVLYIGDSISCATRYVATQTSNWQIAFDGYGTSKALDNPFLEDSIRLFAAQEGGRDAIIFNNGLHGWHLEDETEYKNCFEKMVNFLLDEFKNTPLMIVLTTHIADAEREKRVVARNKVAAEIAEKYNLSIIDLYDESLKHKRYLKKDGVHFTENGYKIFAEKIVSVIKENII